MLYESAPELEGVRLRAERDGDVEFLRALYAASREREMALLAGWSEDQRREFLDQQFHAQRTHYRRHYPSARFDVIERQGVRIGRLYVAHLERELRLMDVALLPAERSQGLGGALCRGLMAEAVHVGKIVSLHVEDDNPAKRLYERLGFVVVGDVTFYKLMHWCPPGLEAVSAALKGQVNTAS